MIGLEFVVLYALLGAFVGFMAGLLGVAGGGILVPLLVAIFSYQGVGTDQVVQLALGTSLACMIVSSAASTRAHAARGTVLWDVARAMAPGIVVSALLTSRVAASFNPAYIAVFFSALMAIIAVQLFTGWQPGRSQRPANRPGLFLVGTVIGFVSALASVGGGFLAITYLNFKNVDTKKAISTSAAIGLAIALSGTVGYMASGWSATLGEPYTLGFIYVPAFLLISLTSSIAASYGASWSHSLPESHLKKILAVVSLILSIRMLFLVVGS